MAKEKAMPAEQTEGGVHLHKTKNNQNAKSVAIELLQARLADSIDMALITKQAHWNLKGPQFIGVHLMLDTFRSEQDEFVDTMAERITQLGGTARGTLQEVGKKTALPALSGRHLPGQRPHSRADRPLRDGSECGSGQHRRNRRGGRS